MDKSRSEYDVVVVGGGPAGLQATLTLARVHRRVLMADSGAYRNQPAAHMHNVISRDGTPPAEFRAAARAELAAYDTVTIHDGSVASIEPAGAGFLVALDDHVVSARGVVLATGLVDTLPDVPGLAELWGGAVAQCPFCHGHEYADRPVAVLGVTAAGHLPGIMRPVASRITVLTDGEELTTDLPPDVAVRAERVTGVCPSPAGARITFAGGPDEEVAGLFVVPALSQRAPFAAHLGLALNPSGCVEVDVMGRTSVPGVHAAGDMAHVPALPMPMASVITAAASGQVAAAAMVQRLIG